MEVSHLLSQTQNALETFYQSTNDNERESAHKWLVNLQNSSQGWQLCWKLLTEGESQEVLYFGANLLHFKISHFWKDIPEEQYVSFRTEIVTLIGKFCNRYKIVLSKLCQALCAFLIRSAPEHWVNSVEQSVSAVQDVIRGIPEEHATMVILEYLTTLADEFNITTFAPSRKGSVRLEIEEYVPDLTRMLQLLLNSQANATIKCMALRCMSSWIAFGLSWTDCEILYPAVLSSITIPELTDNSAEVLTEMLSSPCCFALNDSIFKFIAKLTSLEGVLLKAISESDNDLVSAICRILVVTGETNSKLLVNPKTSEQEVASITLVKLVLHCTGISGNYPTDETCSETTFSFWYALQDELMTIESDRLTDHQKSFFEAFKSLLQILYRKVQYPDDKVYGDFSDDEKEQLRCYRHDVQDTVMYIYSFLRENCLHYLVELLKYLLSGQVVSSWMEIEGVLFLIQGVSEYVEATETTYMPDVFALLTSLPSHPKIADRAILMVGAFCDWLQSHPNELLATLPLLQSGLTQKSMASACSLAIRDISRECAESLPEPTAKSLLLACRDALRSPNLSHREKTRCVESFGCVVSTLPEQALIGELESLNKYLLQEFQHWFSFPVNPTVLENLKHQLQCYSALFRTVDPVVVINPHPLLNICHCLQPMFKQLISLSCDEETVNSLVTCIRKALENVREALDGDIPDTVDILLTIFSGYSHYSILDVSATVVCLFATEAQGGNSARALFRRISQISIERMEQGEWNGNPACVQSFFDFGARVLRTIPALVIDDEHTQVKIIQCILHALNFQEKPTIRSTCNLLVNYVSTCMKNPEKSGVLNSFGQSIVSSVLFCIAGGSPRASVEFFADVLFVFNRYNVSLMANWLQNCLQQDGFPSTLANTAAKEQFEKAVLREKGNKRKLKDIVNEFSLLCRGLYGTAYASK